MATDTDNPQTPAHYAWADIRPKVSAAGLAYALGLAVTATLTEIGVDLETLTTQSWAGFASLLAAYLWPDR